ncbi:Sensor protein FixL [Novipirellula galeiformis]|uniref:Sensor protein FixL n=1 Tax=Novipirellula galeiformis TaxID=2528004 RepID=A0A5C6CB56_9BACT|nr:PAS domain S-box protein [Novipirellula galeiformis]TWU21458.1 Sensor protein FixL [Novipirellula galeiformis]
MTAKANADEAFQPFADAMPAMIWTCAADGSATFFNQKWCELTGMSMKDSLGDGWAQVIHPDDRERVLATWQHATQTPLSHDIELRYRMADGSYRWHLVSAIPMLHADGTVSHWQRICTDIEAQRSSLESSETLMQAFVDSAVDGIITIDHQGRIESCNPSGCVMFGYDESEIIGQNVSRLMPPSFATRHDDHLASYLQTGEKKIIGIGRELVGQRKDGTVFPMKIAVSEVHVGGRKRFAGIVHDLTERDRLQDELRGRQRVLERVAKGRPLSEVLDTLIAFAEESRPDMIASTLVLDKQEGCLRHGASRQLPDFYLEVIDGVVPGPKVGSCGTAAFTGERVVVEDIKTDPLWEDYRDLATRANLRACWSEPIIASCGRVVGTFAMYYTEPRSPDAEDLQFVESCAKVAAIAIERERVDSQLRQMAAIVDSTDDAIILKNLKGVIEKWNHGAERVYGYSAAEAVGQPIAMLVPDDRAYELKANTETIRQGGKVDHYETVRVTKDGRRIHISSTLSPVRDTEGRLTHFVDVQNDITQRVQVQDEIARERAVLDTIVSGIPDALLMADLDRKLTHCNQGAYEMFGYAPTELIGQPKAILYANPDQHSLQGMQRFNPAARQHTEVVEIEWRRKNGDVFTGETVGTIIRDRSGKPISYLALIRDITDRKHAEATIRESNRKLSLLLSNLPGAAFRIAGDADFTVEFVSDGCLELTGYSASELTTGRMLLFPEDLDEVRKKLNRSVAEREPFDFVHRARHRNGEIRRIWARGQGVFSDEGELIAIEAFISDFTELHDAREQLVQSERLAAVGQMISAIAHESRNALQRIQAGTDMLGLELDEHSDAHNDLQRINRAKEDLLHLFEDLRSYAAPIQLDVRAKNLAEVWHQAWANLEVSRTGCDAELLENTGGLELTCIIDAFRIEQVFRNLMENALAACSSLVRLTVSCTESEINGAPAVCVSICDNGPGLTDEQRARVFEAFFTTKSKGTGLGMAIAKRIVEAHQGTIAVGDARDGGAEFLITLPRTLS